MNRPGWSSADIAGDLHTKHEHDVLGHMVDEYGDPKPRFRNWTPQEALRRCRHLAEQREREYAHGTGATQ